MKYIIAYDIQNKTLRKKFAALLMSYGFGRLQKSAFIGEVLNDSLFEQIHLFINLLNLKNDSIMLCPVCIDDYNKIEFIGSRFSKEPLTESYLKDDDFLIF